VGKKRAVATRVKYKESPVIRTQSEFYVQGVAAIFGKFYTYGKNDTAQLKYIRFH
jgi:hypothetical protein